MITSKIGDVPFRQLRGEDGRFAIAGSGEGPFRNRCGGIGSPPLPRHALRIKAG
jgi:hypothetical protein